MIVAPATIVGAGTASGLVAASLTHDAGRAAFIGIAVVATGALARWLWKAILRQMRAEIQAANQPNQDALEQAIGKRIDDLATRNDMQHAETAERLGSIEHRFAVVEANTQIHAERLDRGAERMSTMFAALDELQDAVKSLRRPVQPTLPPPPTKEDPAA